MCVVYEWYELGLKYLSFRFVEVYYIFDYWYRNMIYCIYFIVIYRMFDN